MLPIVIFVFGNSGSGKTTLAKKIASILQAIYICPDDIRLFINGNILDQSQNAVVWDHVRKNLKTVLGFDHRRFVILDATFAKSQERMDMIEHCLEVGANEVWGIFLDTPLEVCISRQNLRGYQIPKRAIIRMERSLREGGFGLTDGFDHFFTVTPNGLITHDSWS
jgi:predicted kinase